MGQAAENIAEEFKNYAYSVSHDLSNPARAMTEFSKILSGRLNDQLSGEDREILDMIITSGTKLQKMMDGLLQFSRLNTVAEDFTLIESEHVANEAIQDLSKHYAMKADTFTLKALPKLRADRHQLHMLFMVLFENALLYQPPNQAPLIEVSATQAGDMWHFTVHDNGIGICKQFHPCIFKLFRRLHTDDEYPGVGIGLTLAEKIIKKRSGDIWVESVPGNGATFHFTWPHHS